VISSSSHTPAKCKIYNSQKIGNKKDLVWEFPQPEANPYQLEWNHLIAAIRDNQPYNEVERVAKVVKTFGDFVGGPETLESLLILWTCRNAKDLSQPEA
jgi:hypothetical protein